MASISATKVESLTQFESFMPRRRRWHRASRAPLTMNTSCSTLCSCRKVTSAHPARPSQTELQCWALQWTHTPAGGGSTCGSRDTPSSLAHTMPCRHSAAGPRRLVLFASLLATLLRPSGAAGNSSNASTPVASPPPPPPPAITACPAANATANFSCYVGVFPFRADVLAYTSGGGCTCNCSANATSATSDYAGEPFLPPSTIGLAVTYAAFPAVCGQVRYPCAYRNADCCLTPTDASPLQALCQSAFPTKCSHAAYVNASFTPLGSWLTANASTQLTYAYPSPVVVAPGSVCVAYIAQCSPLRATNLCPQGLTTNNVTVYSAVSAAGCTTLLGQATRYAPFLTVVTACNSAGCNVPQAPPPPSPPPPPPAPVMPPPPSAAKSGGVWMAAPHKHCAAMVLLSAAATLL